MISRTGMKEKSKKHTPKGSPPKGTEIPSGPRRGLSSSSGNFRQGGPATMLCLLSAAVGAPVPSTQPPAEKLLSTPSTKGGWYPVPPARSRRRGCLPCMPTHTGGRCSVQGKLLMEAASDVKDGTYVPGKRLDEK